MKLIRSTILVGAMFTALPAAARNKEVSPPRAQALTSLVACRSIANDAERLACFDGQVAALDAAEARKEIVVADKTQIRKARRSLFGLTLPNLGIFGGGSEEEAAKESEEIEATIARSYQASTGRWVIFLEDGAKWVQTDSRELLKGAKPGRMIKIRRAAMGSFLANVDGQIAIRMRRENQ